MSRAILHSSHSNIAALRAAALLKEIAMIKSKTELL